MASPAIVIQVSSAEGEQWCPALRFATGKSWPMEASRQLMAAATDDGNVPSACRPTPLFPPPAAHCLQANSVFGALRALESLSQMLRRRRVPPGSALEELVPPEAIWPAEDEQQGGQRSEGQGSEGERAAGAAGLLQRRRKKKDKTVLLVEEVDIYDSPRFRYR